MSRKRNSKWYKTPYQYADDAARSQIERNREKMADFTKEYAETEEGKAEIRSLFNVIVELAFQFQVNFEDVIDYIEWLYINDYDDDAIALALRALKVVNEMTHPRRSTLARLCNCIEDVVSEQYGSEETEEIMEQLLMIRVAYDLT